MITKLFCTALIEVHCEQRRHVFMITIMFRMIELGLNTFPIRQRLNL